MKVHDWKKFLQSRLNSRKVPTFWNCRGNERPNFMQIRIFRVLCYVVLSFPGWNKYGPQSSLNRHIPVSVFHLWKLSRKKMICKNRMCKSMQSPSLCSLLWSGLAPSGEMCIQVLRQFSIPCGAWDCMVQTGWQARLIPKDVQMAHVNLAGKSIVLALRANVTEPKPKFAKDASCLKPGVASKMWQSLSIMPGELHVWPLICFGLNIPLFHLNLFLKDFPRLVCGFLELTKSTGREDKPQLKLRRLLDSRSSVKSCSPGIPLGLVFLGLWVFTTFVLCSPNRI